MFYLRAVLFPSVCARGSPRPPASVMGTGWAGRLAPCLPARPPAFLGGWQLLDIVHFADRRSKFTEA